MSGTGTARALRDELSDPWSLVERLDLLDGPRSFVRQAGGLIIRCPWHDDRTPSCSVRVGPDGTIAVRCHGCGATGDALSLVAVAAGLDVRADFPAVVRRAADLAGRWELLGGDNEHVAPTVPRRIVPAAHERDYPPRSELAALLASTVPVSADAEAVAMLAARGLEADRTDDAGLARVLPVGASVPRWATYRGAPWSLTGHRLVVPVVDATGEVRSVRAWRVNDADSPKRLPPAGCRASGLVLACEFAVAMLRGTFAPQRVVVLEGEPDFLSWTAPGTKIVAARIGIMSGSWTPELAAKIPDGAQVAIRTHQDEAGDRYALQIARSLRGRCRLSRPRHDGRCAA